MSLLWHRHIVPQADHNSGFQVWNKCSPVNQVTWLCPVSQVMFVLDVGPCWFEVYSVGFSHTDHKAACSVRKGWSCHALYPTPTNQRNRWLHLISIMKEQKRRWRQQLLHEIWFILIGDQIKKISAACILGDVWICLWCGYTSEFVCVYYRIVCSLWSLACWDRGSWISWTSTVTRWSALPRTSYGRCGTGTGTLNWNTRGQKIAY